MYRTIAVCWLIYFPDQVLRCFTSERAHYCCKPTYHLRKITINIFYTTGYSCPDCSPVRHTWSSWSLASVADIPLLGSSYTGSGSVRRSSLLLRPRDLGLTRVYLVDRKLAPLAIILVRERLVLCIVYSLSLHLFSLSLPSSLGVSRNGLQPWQTTNHIICLALASGMSNLW